MIRVISASRECANDLIAGLRLVRLLLVDTNPAMAWIQPMLGDLDETKKIMAESDAASKATRAARRSGNAVGAVPPRVPTAGAAALDQG